MKTKIRSFNKKFAYLLCLILVAAFLTGCTDEYYYQMDADAYESDYDEWENNNESDSNASGGADYAESDEDYSGEYAYEENSDVSKGNSGNTAADIDYTFRNDGLLESHYEKHGEDMGFNSPEEYEAAANRVIDDEDVLHKIEAEDGDDVYYLERTNEFVVVSKDGYIRTYFYPNDGIDYFNRQ